MTNAESNAILYYADFLSLKYESHPVTDNCKYFYIRGVPINSAYILGMTPEYDEERKYYGLNIKLVHEGKYEPLWKQREKNAEE